MKVQLTDEQRSHARRVAEGRNATGGPSRTPDSGFNPIRVDEIGAMGEIAVCEVYGENWREMVRVEKERPKDDLTDLVIRGKKIGVKSRERFDLPLDMIVPDYDTGCDFYFLCSVALERGYVHIRGFLTRDELLSYEPEAWKWTTDRPGAQGTRQGARRRYVPVEALRECQSASREKATVVSTLPTREERRTERVRMLYGYTERVKENGVTVNGKIATLVMAHDTPQGCGVVFAAEREKVRDNKGKETKQPIMRFVDCEEVEPL